MLYGQRGALFMLRAPEHKTKTLTTRNYSGCPWTGNRIMNSNACIYTGAGWKLTRCQIRSQFGRPAWLQRKIIPTRQQVHITGSFNYRCAASFSHTSLNLGRCIAGLGFFLHGKSRMKDNRCMSTDFFVEEWLIILDFMLFNAGKGWGAARWRSIYSPDNH
jgi:hypothetical protein